MSDVKTVVVKINMNTGAGSKYLKNSFLPPDYIEIYKPVEHLKFLIGSWLRIYDKNNRRHESGGFLVKIDAHSVTLRNKITIDIEIKKYDFYIKKDNPQYMCLKEFIIERQKFQKEKEIFEKTSQKFYKLFLDGKIKIFN